MPSNLLTPTQAQGLTPAMLTVLWVIGNELDQKRLPATVKDAVWLEIPSKKLKPRGRKGNEWLRECLTRVQGLQIGGEYRSNPWGCVLVAEWHIVEGGTLTRILVPPAGIQAMRLGETFAKIELEAAYKLQGPARRLYAALADKKHQDRKRWHEYSLDELRALLAVSEKKGYQRWGNLRQWILTPAIEQINDFGTVVVKMTPIKRGRSVVAVRFDWRWKTIDEARETAKSPTATPQESGEDQKPRSEEEKKRGLEAIAEAKRKLAAARPSKKRASAIERLPGEQPLPLGLPDEEEGLKPASDYLPDKKAASG